MKTSRSRILTTHAGSLIRTPELVEVMIQRELDRPVDDKSYLENLRKGVHEVVKQQAETGIDVVSDGEFGKSGWIQYVSERLSGLEPMESPRPPLNWPEQERFGGFYRIYHEHENTQWLPDAPSKGDYKGTNRSMAYHCTGPLIYQTDALERDIENAKIALRDVRVEEAFLPVVAPCSVEGLRNDYYKTQEEYLFALAEALADEYRMIVNAGFILQVDDAILPMQYFLNFRDKGMDEFRKWAEVRIEALNHALKGIPEDKVRYHICWGSQNIPHTTDPALRDFVDLILKVKAQAYSIEAANPRHEHEWKVWEDVKLPMGKVLIPGVISHATNIVEHPELVAQRLTNFASLVGRENVMAGTDCGFSQFWNLVRVHPEVQWAKLEAMVEGARIASKQLWN
jgi:5-methyltetrahydropteroyltriglutamate--homocysteine methyltransferase